MFKKFRKVAIKVAALALAFTLTATVAFAAEKKPGESGSESIAHVDGIYGIQGTISYSGNQNIFEGGKVTLSHNLSNLAGQTKESAIFIYGTEASTGDVLVNYKVASDATPGDSCTITLNYDTSDENGNMTRQQVGSVTVTVVKASSGSSTGGSTGGSTGDSNTGSNTGSTGVTSPTTVTPSKKSDLTELQSLIAIADELNKADYTSDSWKALIDALNKAKAIKDTDAQSVVDAAAAELQAAIDGLVKIDYTKLLAAIDAAEDLMNNEEFAQLWNELLAAFDNANANLKGTSQEEVDAAAVALNTIVDKLNELLAEMNTVAEPTEPAEGVCTIPFHKLLIILLVISVCLNVVFGFIIANNSKKRKQDNVPMVDL